MNRLDFNRSEYDLTLFTIGLAVGSVFGLGMVVAYLLGAWLGSDVIVLAPSRCG